MAEGGMTQNLTDEYNTALEPDEEMAFQQWANQNKRLKDLYDYDMRGWWKENVPPLSESQRDQVQSADAYNKINQMVNQDAFERGMAQEPPSQNVVDLRTPQQYSDEDKAKLEELYNTQINPPHLTDKFKKPNHPTFSSNSQYHGVNGQFGGQWTQLPDKSWTFRPGISNIQSYGVYGLQDYFKQHEKGNRLILPEGF